MTNAESKHRLDQGWTSDQTGNNLHWLKVGALQKDKKKIEMEKMLNEQSIGSEQIKYVPHTKASQQIRTN